MEGFTRDSFHNISEGAGLSEIYFKSNCILCPAFSDTYEGVYSKTPMPKH